MFVTVSYILIFAYMSGATYGILLYMLALSLACKWNWLTVTNILAYYNTEFIKAEKVCNVNELAYLAVT